jgi:hypothetical protein
MKKLLILLAMGLALAAIPMGYAVAKDMTGEMCGYPHYERGTVKNIPFLMGGVGEDERLCLEPAENNYNLRLEFALTSGEYLADPTVRIQDASGNELINMVSEGPWLLVKLPAGEYRVTVSREGHETEVRHVRVGESLRTAMFYWKTE